MSEHNNDQSGGGNQNQNQGGQQQQGQGRKGLLEYYFTPYNTNVVFQLISQHPAVTAFLEQQPGRTFKASNGYRIGLGWLYPEWKMSNNILYLDGTDGDRLDKNDVTRFPVDGEVYRDGQMALVKTALAELVNLVKKTFGETLRLKPERRNPRIVLA
jgi:hypothetical protein